MASAYKDWLHLNVFDAGSGTIGIFNISLHGSPQDSRSRAVGTALVHTDDGGWSGNLEIRGIEESFFNWNFIGLAKMGMAIQASPPSLMTSVSGIEALRSIRIKATSISDAIAIDLPMPFGPGLDLLERHAAAEG